jgi:hypothetical protein
MPHRTKNQSVNFELVNSTINKDIDKNKELDTEVAFIDPNGQGG